MSELEKLLIEQNKTGKHICDNYPNQFSTILVKDSASAIRALYLEKLPSEEQITEIIYDSNELCASCQDRRLDRVRNLAKAIKDEMTKAVETL